MSSFTWDVASLDTLRKQWSRSIRFGVLMAPLHPTPDVGQTVEVRIRCTWEGKALEVTGDVVLASEASSVVQLGDWTASAIASGPPTTTSIDPSAARSPEASARGAASRAWRATRRLPSAASGSIRSSS